MSVERMAGGLPGTAEEVATRLMAAGSGSAEASGPVAEVTRKVSAESNNATQDKALCYAHGGTR